MYYQNTFRYYQKFRRRHEKQRQSTLTPEESKNFNKFFTTFGKTLADKLVPEEKHNTKNTNVNSVLLHKISEKEQSLAIKNLKNEYSSEYDGLNNFILKKLQFAIIPTLPIWSTIDLYTAFSRIA